MKLHVVSDLHLSLADFELPECDADIVVVAGDVARPEPAMKWLCALGKPVLYVAGNHEFYGSSLTHTLAELRRLSAGTRVRLLEKQQVVIDGVRFLGTTLWSDFGIFRDEATRVAAMDTAHTVIRDFTRIWVDDAKRQLFTPEDSARLLAEDRAWLEAVLGEPFPGPTVVITHHAPSLQSVHPRFAHSLLNGCFVSNLESLMGGSRVALWIHGHTHDSFDYRCRCTRVVCNPRGYVQHGIAENAVFDPALVIDIDTLQTRARQPTS